MRSYWGWVSNLKLSTPPCFGGCSSLHCTDKHHLVYLMLKKNKSDDCEPRSEVMSDFFKNGFMDVYPRCKEWDPLIVAECVCVMIRVFMSLRGRGVMCVANCGSGVMQKTNKYYCKNDHAVCICSEHIICSRSVTSLLKSDKVSVCKGVLITLDCYKPQLYCHFNRVQQILLRRRQFSLFVAITVGGIMCPSTCLSLSLFFYAHARPWPHHVYTQIK